MENYAINVTAQQALDKLISCLVDHQDFKLNFIHPSEIAYLCPQSKAPPPRERFCYYYYCCCCC